MKKVTCLFLILTLLLSVAVLFSACKNRNDTQVSGDIVELDLSEYSLTYGKDLTQGGKEAAGLLAAELKYLTGTKLRAWLDEEDEEVSTDEYEILVGETNRTETFRALNRIEGSGWIIAVIGNKLVIVGSSPFLTRVAITYFSENYVKESAIDGTKLKVNKEIIRSNLSTITVEDISGKASFEIVYDDIIDDYDNGGKDNYDYAADPNPTTGGPNADKTYKISLQVRDKLAALIGLSAETIVMKDDAAPKTDQEILVGNLDGREEFVSEMAKLNANEYGVAIRNGKIMLLAWNDVVLPRTLDVLDDMLEGCRETSGAGKSRYVIPNDCTMTEVYECNWEVDFPKPAGEGMVLRGVVDVSNDSLEYIYTGNGANSDAFTAYCSQLEAAGYRTIADEWNINDNRFRTYVNEAEQVTLHLSYTHYKHAAEFNITDGLPGIRVVSASTKKVTLPSAEMLNATQFENETYYKVVTPKLTQLKLDYKAGSFGNAYIYTLSDGSFIVYDGGRGDGNDVGNMWKALNDLYEEAFGTGPTSQKPIHIRAWILSHEHGDHFKVFRGFCEEYGDSTDLQFDALLFNPVSASERENSNNPEYAIQTNMASIQSKVTDGFQFIKMHTGQTFYFANLKMEVLYTHEDTYPKGLEYFNNSSTVFRTTVKSVGDGETEETTMLWLGDSERIGGRRLAALYGETLKSDMAQVAHHGWNGVDLLCYQLIEPEVLWWPVVYSSFKGQVKTPTATTKWSNRVDYEIANNLASVKMILVADTYNTTMKFDGSGNGQSSLYDLDGAQIVFSNTLTGGTVIKKS
ncbi:MAG: hypothetical protein E7585_07260 [Ruminococcaceae bacterium]|nr:hypothetical protein [Oscillospiraceae bacterium]